MKKKKHLHICQSIFSFLYYKCIFIKIYLCTKKVLYSLTYSLFLETFSLCRCSLQLHTVCSSPRSTCNPFGVQQDIDTGSLPFTVLLFCWGVSEPCWSHLGAKGCYGVLDSRRGNLTDLLDCHETILWKKLNKTQTKTWTAVICMLP